MLHAQHCSNDFIFSENSKFDWIKVQNSNGFSRLSRFDSLKMHEPIHKFTCFWIFLVYELFMRNFIIIVISMVALHGRRALELVNGTASENVKGTLSLSNTTKQAS